MACEQVKPKEMGLLLTPAVLATGCFLENSGHRNCTHTLRSRRGQLKRSIFISSPLPCFLQMASYSLEDMRKEKEAQKREEKRNLTLELALHKDKTHRLLPLPFIQNSSKIQKILREKNVIPIKGWILSTVYSFVQGSILIVLLLMKDCAWQVNGNQRILFEEHRRSWVEPFGLEEV